jgi:AraC-like DNA-binding protein
MTQAGSALLLGADRALYQGELPTTSWHRHASPVLLLGLSGRFALQWRHGPEVQQHSCHSALVAAGVDHVLDPAGESVAAIYLEPDSAEARSLRGHFNAQGEVMFDVAHPVRTRAHTDTRLSSFDLPALLTLACPPATLVDARVARSLQRLRHPATAAWRRTALAASVHLSASRFNHLFSSEMGVSFRSYRVWSQVRAAVAALGSNPTLTRAALDAGFADSAHFSRMFRQALGLTPSSVLRPLRKVTLLR